MSAALLLALVLLAAYAAGALLLSGLAALAWRAGLKRVLTTSADLLALRLLPAAGGLLIALTVVLPAFVSYEPHRGREAVGPWLMLLAGLALASIGHGAWRGWRACAGARALLLSYGPLRRRVLGSGQEIGVIDLVDVVEPVVAVIGGFRPRIVAAACVAEACSADEFREVLAHEAAHVAARDNLKQLLFVAAPDPLAWTSLAPTLLARWRAASELEADRRATGDDPRRRLALAAALIKVARRLSACEPGSAALAMPVASGDVEDRVRQLLAPRAVLPAAIVRALGLAALLTPVLALSHYGAIHELIETLVALGR